MVLQDLLYPAPYKDGEQENNAFYFVVVVVQCSVQHSLVRCWCNAQYSFPASCWLTRCN